MLNSAVLTEMAAKSPRVHPEFVHPNEAVLPPPPPKRLVWLVDHR